MLLTLVLRYEGGGPALRQQPEPWQTRLRSVRMGESTSRMVRTSVPGIYKLSSGLFLVRIRIKAGSVSQSFRSMAGAKQWQRATLLGLESKTLVIRAGQLLERAEASRLDRT